MTFSRLRQGLEKGFGLPKLEDLASLTDKIPDKEHLELYLKLLETMPDAATMKELNKFLVNAQKLSEAAPDLQLVCQLFSMVKELNFAEINMALGELAQIMKKVPKEGLDQLIKMAQQGGE